jgi:6-phosphogluconolactonase
MARLEQQSPRMALDACLVAIIFAVSAVLWLQRRRLAAAACAAAKAAGLAAAKPDEAAVAPPARPPIVFAGTDSEVFAFEFGADGRLTPAGSSPPIGNPSWLCFDPASTRMYCVDESSQSGGCAALNIIARDTPTPLRVINKVPDPLSPSGPCHCVVDNTGRWLLASNYAHGSIVVYAINSDGSLGRVADSRSFGSELQPSHAHCGVFAPGNRHAFVCDLGLDGIHQFSFDDATGKLREHEDEPFVRSSKGSGPRHIAFHPNGVAAYVINEKDSTVDTFSYIQVFGRLVRHQTLSSLPPGFEGESYCAEIKVSSDGRHVYGSNRGISSNQEVPEHVRFYRLD